MEEMKKKSTKKYNKEPFDNKDHFRGETTLFCM